MNSCFRDMMNHQFDKKLAKVSHLDLYCLSLGCVIDYQDVRREGVVRKVEVEGVGIGQRDDFANVGRAERIAPMNRWGDVHPLGVGLANCIAQTRVGQVDAEVDLANEAVLTVLQNMMDCYLAGFRPEKESIQSRMDVVGLLQVVVLRNMMNWY